MVGVQVPVGGGGLDGEAVRFAQPPHDLPRPDSRLVPFSLWAVEPRRDDSETRSTRGDLARDGKPRGLDVAIPQHLGRRERHAEASGADRPVAGLALHEPALDRGAARAVIVEIAGVLFVAVGSQVSDRPHAHPEAIGDDQIELRPKLEAPALDARPHTQVIDDVVTGQSVPLEDEVRLLRRRLEILRLLGSREARREESGADRKENASRAARHLDSIMPCPASRSIRP